MCSYRTAEASCSPCDPAQRQRPCRCSLIHSREQLVYKSTASLCLWCCYAEIRFFIVQRGLLLPSGFISHRRKTSKGDEAFLWFFGGCLGGNQLHLLGERDSWRSPSCTGQLVSLPVWHRFRLISLVLYHCVSGRIQGVQKWNWKVATVFQGDVAAALIWSKISQFLIVDRKCFLTGNEGNRKRRWQLKNKKKEISWTFVQTAISPPIERFVIKFCADSPSDDQSHWLWRSPDFSSGTTSRWRPHTERQSRLFVWALMSDFPQSPGFLQPFLKVCLLTVTDTENQEHHPNGILRCSCAFITSKMMSWRFQPIFSANSDNQLRIPSALSGHCLQWKARLRERPKASQA